LRRDYGDHRAEAAGIVMSDLAAGGRACDYFHCSLMIGGAFFASMWRDARNSS
jgi:hypothetical protein